MGPLPSESDSVFGTEERAERLLTGFRWAETPQGHAFWEHRFWQFLSGGKRGGETSNEIQRGAKPERT